MSSFVIIYIYNDINTFVVNGFEECIWVRSRRCGFRVTWFCYQLIAKPGNTTAAPPCPDPYDWIQYSWHWNDTAIWNPQDKILLILHLQRWFKQSGVILTFEMHIGYSVRFEKLSVTLYHLKVGLGEQDECGSHPVVTFLWQLVTFSSYFSPGEAAFCLTHLPLLPHIWIVSALVQIMACHLFGAKTISEPMLYYCQLDP